MPRTKTVGQKVAEQKARGAKLAAEKETAPAKPTRKQANPATPQSEMPLTENTAQANRERIAAARESEKANKKVEIAVAGAKEDAGLDPTTGKRLRVLRKRCKSLADANKARKAFEAQGRVVTIKGDGKKGAFEVIGRLPDSGPKLVSAPIAAGAKGGRARTPSEKLGASESRTGLAMAHGFTRPKGGKTGRVWDLADANPDASRADVVALAVKEGLNKNMAMTQYGRWRKFVGR